MCCYYTDRCTCCVVNVTTKLDALAVFLLLRQVYLLCRCYKGKCTGVNAGVITTQVAQSEIVASAIYLDINAKKMVDVGFWDDILHCQCIIYKKTTTKLNTEISY